MAATMESLKSMSKTVTIQGAASKVMNLGLYLSGVDLAAEGELERINQLADVYKRQIMERSYQNCFCWRMSRTGD